MSDETPRIEVLEDAGWLVYDHLLDYYEGKGGKLHPETVIGAAAALAGEQILRACHAPDELTGGGAIASQPAHLMMCLDTENSTVLEAIQVASAYDEKEAPDMAGILTRTAKAVGTMPFPPLTVPERNKPKEWSQNAAVVHREFIQQTKVKQKLSDFEMAIALGCCIGEMVEEFSEKLPIKIGVQLAMEVMAGSIRLKPLPRVVEG